MYDLIIIGGGPAGIVAGIYGARKKLKTLILTKDFIGQAGLTGTIENWPGEKNITGPELMNKFESHLKNYDVEIKDEEVISLEKDKDFSVKTKEEEFNSKAVIIATGRKPRALNIPGENEFVGKGIVYCTTCDAPLFKDKKVIVVGGGNAGLESAIELTDHTNEVFLFEAASQLSGDEFLQEKAKEKGVKIFTNRKIKEIKGSNFVEEVLFEDSGEEEKMQVEGVFIQIGSIPINEFIADNLVDFNQSGEVVVDYQTCETKTGGLFAAGDVTNVRDKQIVVATGEGTKASLSAYNYLRK